VLASAIRRAQWHRDTATQGSAQWHRDTATHGSAQWHRDTATHGSAQWHSDTATHGSAQWHRDTATHGRQSTSNSLQNGCHGLQKAVCSVDVGILQTSLLEQNTRMQAPTLTADCFSRNRLWWSDFTVTALRFSEQGHVERILPKQFHRGRVTFLLKAGHGGS
jgi:hypothetical protein